MIQENFLDIKSYAFRKLLDEQWYEQKNGWRMTSGSLGMDLLYMNWEAKFKHPVSDSISVMFQAWQYEFYEVKPIRYRLELAYRPVPLVAISLYGTPAYDKRHASQGGALTLGEAPWNYLKVSHTPQHLFFNEKNLYNEDYYVRHPVEDRIEGALEIPVSGKESLQHLKLRFSALQDHPMEQIFPEQQMRFTHQGNTQDVVLDYHYGKQKLLGITLKQFHFEKQKEAPDSTLTGLLYLQNNRKQTLDYISLDSYWLHPISANYHGTLGLRYDSFTNHFVETQKPEDSLDFNLQTLQLYGILLDSNAENMAWEYGLYAGDTEKSKKFLESSREDELVRRVEIALRISLEIRKPEENSVLLFTTTWNIDDFFNNFWDGGSMSYQKTF